MSEITIIPGRKMSKSEVEAHEKAMIANVGDTGMRLLKIRDEEGYLAVGRASFREYCGFLDEKLGSIRKCYYLVDQAEVNHNLSEALGRPVNLPMKHALALKDLEPEQQLLAFEKATSGYKKGDEKPTEAVFEQAAAEIAPAAAPAKSSGRSGGGSKRDASEGWSEKDLKADAEINDAFGVIRKVYGADDTNSIINGVVAMKRADVLYLAKLPVPKMKEVQDLVFTNRWSPQEAVRFLNAQPDDRSTVEDLKNLCLGTPGKYWTGDFEGFTISVKYNRAPQR
jgi:hypothetical protein